jgi:peptidoglycan/LPS O-acetylase OafA/YrhL
LAFAIVRNFNPLEAACILVIALPATIALAWLGRYMLEEFLLGWRRRREQQERVVDLDFLKDPEPPIEATVVEDGDSGELPP